MKQTHSKWRALLTLAIAIGGVGGLSSCTVKKQARKDTIHKINISVPDQKMKVYKRGMEIQSYPVSTSKFGLGDIPGSRCTPLGKFEVAEKIGGDKPRGAVFKHRQWTGEVIKPNAQGRDPIVSRILWLDGKESHNKNAFSRYIYIHGTAAERDIGKKASYGCVRMKSKHIIRLYDTVGEGATVEIQNRPIWKIFAGNDIDLHKTLARFEFDQPELLADSANQLPLRDLLTEEERAVEERLNWLREDGFQVSYLFLEPE
ncbi:MAG: L,D-transpeptidase family protein, partial [Verrucomicrobiota bacterium]